MPDPVVEAPVKPAPIKMGQSLTSQQAALTKLLQSDEPIKPVQSEKPAKEKTKADESAAAEPPKPVTPAAAEEDYVSPAPTVVELPEIGKYIYDKLPTLQTRIKDGETVKVIQFKDVSELPAGFELADDSARAQFTLDISNQLDKARGAMAEYKKTELRNNQAKFDADEAKDVAGGLKRLQKQGLIGAFEKTEDDDDFNDDPNVKIANEIYKLFKDTNTAFLQKGQLYRISYEDAADKYFAKQSRMAANDSQKAKEQLEEVKPKKTAVQQERDKVAAKTGGAVGGEPTDNKPKVRSGMTMSDINKLVNAGRI